MSHVLVSRGEWDWRSILRFGDGYRGGSGTNRSGCGIQDLDIYFGGAEPFIRDDFLAIVRHAKTHDLSVSFATNGTLLNPNIVQEIVDLGVDRINFSIDGPEDLHDMLRGPGTFGKAVSNLQHVLECKRARNVERPLVTINLTVSPLVVGHLKETIRSIRNTIGDEVDSFRIHHLWFIGPAELSAHRAAVEKALGRSAPGAAAHRIPLSQSIDAIALADEISELKDLEGVDFFPDLRAREIHEFYSEGFRSKRRCRAPFQAVVVKPNGDVRFCPDEWIDDYVLGNIREHEFRDHLEQ